MNKAGKEVVACVISPHGFGHSARNAAIMAAISERVGDVEFRIFTKVPEWFFLDSGVSDFGWHEVECDLGLVQKTTLEEDVDETVERLKRFIPFEQGAAKIAREMEEHGCRMAICDISPMGLAAARLAGIPSVLVENFTWDWIYEGYFNRWPALREPAGVFAAEFARATCRMQTDPVCFPVPCDLRTPPISRRPRTARAHVRDELEIPGGCRMVLMTMGGVSERLFMLPDDWSDSGVVFVIPGGSDAMERRKNAVLLPHHSKFYHPDLVHAADVVVGKLGYSTLAECHAAGVPFGFVPRPRFRESGPLSDYAVREMNAVRIEQECYLSGHWGPELVRLLEQERRPPPAANGADLAAEFLADRFL